MRLNKIPEQLIKTIDTLNTINGGVSEAYVTSKKHEDRLEYQISVPGTAHENYSIQISNGQLFVLNRISGFDSGEEVTRLVALLPIWNYIDYENIKSYFRNGNLIIDMPFNELSRGYNRQIDILPLN